MPYIISIVGQKGGVGKTTVAWNLCFALQKQGYSVKLLDCDDSQHSSSFLQETRLKKDIDISPMTTKEAINFIEDPDNRFDIVILECGGRIDEELKMAIAYGDLIIMPLRPAILEIKTIENVEKLIDKITNFCGDCYVLPNMVSTHYRNKDLQEMLSLTPKYFKFLNTPLSHKISYPNSLAVGKNIFESRDRKAIWEFNQFVDWILNNN